MMVSKSRRYLFASAPKCGTHTMYYILGEWAGGERHGSYHERNLPRELLVNYDAPRQPAARADLDWTFLVVTRNPYSRAVSLWWKCMIEDDGRLPGLAPGHYGFRDRCPDFSIEAFCKELLKGPRRRPVCWPQAEYWATLPRIDFAFKIEDLEPIKSLQIWDHTDFEIPALLPSDRNPDYPADWREVISPEAADYIQRWAAADFDRFGYSRDSSL